MELRVYKTLWGWRGSLAAASQRAVADGFDGLEAAVPADAASRNQLNALLKASGLDYIAEIRTAGSYVPDRRATVGEHLADLETQLSRTAELSPRLVNCIGGCDRWSLADSLAFFQGALELADRAGQTIAFETHRGRSLYSPWVARQVLENMPLPLTCDFSHWCVVCEGLGDSEDSLLREVAGHAVHVHGRVGYDQGPQVADPQSPLYRQDLDWHLRWWRWIWEARRQAGQAISTLTPEFGPDGYQAVDPASGAPLGDLDAINHWMALRVREEFERFSMETLA